MLTTAAIAAAIGFGAHSPSARGTAPASRVLGGPGATDQIAAPSAGATADAVSASDSVSAPSSVSVTPGAARGALAAVAAGTGSSELPAGEVWQCIVNGEMIFSDKRCGNGASVRQIGDINVMDMPSAQPVPYGAYRPAYGAAPYSPAPSYSDDAEDMGNVAADLYPGQALILARERARREHSSRQDHGAHPPPNHALPGPHNPR